MAFGKWPRDSFLFRTFGGVLAALALLAVGCGGGGGEIDNPGPPGTVTLTGRVIRQSTNSAIAGAVISYPGVANAVTDVNGAFSLAIPTPAPQQRLKVSAPGYADWGLYNNAAMPLASQGILVSALAGTRTIDLGTFGLFHSTLDAPSTTITGKVVRTTSCTDPNAVTGCSVNVAGAVISYPGVADVVTDANGNFSLLVPTPAPEQRLKISAPGYEDRGKYQRATVPLATQGVLVPALTGPQTLDLGTFGLYHSTLDPPLPPSSTS